MININVVVDKNKKMEKPCNENCKFYCGKDDRLGDRCSCNTECKEYIKWFQSASGWRKVVEPFRALKKGN